MAGGTVHSRRKGEWQAQIPLTVLTAVVINADPGALWCDLGAKPHVGVFVLVFAPWPAATVLACSLRAFPVAGPAISARCAGHHPHGPHRPLPHPAIHHALKGREALRRRKAAQAQTEPPGP